MTRPPIAALRFSLLLLATAVLLAALGVVWSRGEAREAHAQLERQQAARDAAQQTLTRSREQQQLIGAHLGDYQALAARGFVGAEDRLAWIEAVQLANQAAGLYGLEYRLAPRTASDPALAQGLPLGQTAMNVSMALLVETDLTRFLSALQARAPGIYRVRGCRVARPGNEPFTAVNQPRLKADCELLWYTVAPQGEASP